MLRRQTVLGTQPVNVLKHSIVISSSHVLLPVLSYGFDILCIERLTNLADLWLDEWRSGWGRSRLLAGTQRVQTMISMVESSG